MSLTSEEEKIAAIIDKAMEARELMVRREIDLSSSTSPYRSIELQYLKEAYEAGYLAAIKEILQVIADARRG